MKSFNTIIIALSNQKGGVGKTSSAVNIASFLAITESPVLIIDMDSVDIKLLKSIHI